MIDGNAEPMQDERTKDAFAAPAGVGAVDGYVLGDFPVSRIGFGAMQLPGPGVWGPPRDRGEALTVLRRAVELGVDHIDTAQYYGPGVASELIREALHPYPGNLALVSKVGARRDQAGGWLPCSDPDQLRAGIEDNLRSLGVGQLAAVNLRVTGDEPDRRFDDQLTAMIQAREDGLIGGVGLSNITLERLRWRTWRRTSAPPTSRSTSRRSGSSPQPRDKHALRHSAAISALGERIALAVVRTGPATPARA